MKTQYKTIVAKLWQQRKKFIGLWIATFVPQFF